MSCTIGSVQGRSKENWDISVDSYISQRDVWAIRYQGTLTSVDVCGALYLEADEDIDPDNEIVFHFLQRYIDTLNEEGMHTHMFIIRVQNNVNFA